MVIPDAMYTSAQEIKSCLKMIHKNITWIKKTDKNEYY
jgi:hypothetical protein